MNEQRWEIVRGEGPLVATAIHDGHEIRAEVAEKLAISDSDRLREEDPYTGPLTAVAGTTIVVRRSRFEVDLNRRREKAVYRRPEDAWGLQVWKKDVTEEIVARSLEFYDGFYRKVHRMLTELTDKHGYFVVFDLHSYNHRRGGPGSLPAPPEENPEVNVGTGTMDRAKWGPLVDRFMEDLRTFDFLGRKLDVRENVKFRGGHFSQWIHESFPGAGCSLAIEYKKFFMDEWTGECNMAEHEAMKKSLMATIPGIHDSLKALKG